MSNVPEITVRIPVPSQGDLANNRNVVLAAFQDKREVRIRFNIDVYGPGTTDNPKARYYSFCGTSCTVTCRSLKAVEHTMTRIRELVIELNGWTEKEKAHA